jgi:FtsZ-interacting cell division protein ZipA
MSELQIWLLVLGVLVIAAVIAYNRYQEVRFRRRAEAAFAAEQTDALMERAPAPERIEPQFQSDAGEEPADAESRREPRGVEVVPGPQTAPQVDRISYSAELHAGDGAIPPSALQAFLGALDSAARRVRLEGRNDTDAAWSMLDPGKPAAVRHVRVSLQLADRRGPLTTADMALFQSALARCAASIPANADIPEAEPFLARARELDAFCADVDVAVGINIVAPPGRPFTGTRLRSVCEATGFRLVAGAFAFPDGAGGTRFTLEHQQQVRLTAESLRSQQIGAVTLVLDVPRLSDGVKAFDEMVDVGRQVASALGGTLVDDNSQPVSEPGLEQIRNQLRGIYGAMQAHGIPPGSPLALRLFS